MRTFRFILFAIVVISTTLPLLIGCGGAATGEVLPTLDLAAAIDKPRVTDLAEIAADIEFVPLDDSMSDALVGNITEIAESKNFWYVREFGSNSAPIKMFDRMGKFVATRGQIGRGPDEFNPLFTLTTDWGRDNLYLGGRNSGSSGNLMSAFDAAGNRFARYDSIVGPQAAFHEERLITFSPSTTHSTPKPDTTRTLLHSFSPDIRLTGSLEGADRGSELIAIPAQRMVFNVARSFLSNNGKDIFVKEGRSDTAYLYRNDMTLAPALVLDLGPYAIPAGAWGMEPTEGWDNRYRGINALWVGDRHIIVRAVARVDNGFSNSLLVFDRDLDFGGFSAVGESGEAGLFLDGIAFAPMYIRDNRLVGYMQALDIIDNRDRVTQPELKALSATIREDSNPVIVIAELKK
jgi:hypothetical protein